PRIVRRVVRHDPRPVHPGGPVNDGSFRRAIGADKTVAATPERLSWRATHAKTENRKPKTENRKPKTENRKPKTENRKPKIIPAAGRQNPLNLLRFFPAHSFQPDGYQSQ